MSEIGLRSLLEKKPRSNPVDEKPLMKTTGARKEVVHVFPDML